MYSTCENSTESDPQEDNRAPHSAGKSSEDRTKSGDVQQLYQEQLPCRHDNVVDAIIDCDCRGLTVIRSECIVYKGAVGEVPADQDRKTDKETNHNITLPSYMVPMHPTLSRICYHYADQFAIPKVHISYTFFVSSFQKKNSRTCFIRKFS